MFELGGGGGAAFAPASERQVLAALLAGLRDAHWVRPPARTSHIPS